MNGGQSPQRGRGLLLLLLLCVPAAVFLSLTMGAVRVPWGQWASASYVPLTKLRLARAVLGLAVGASLASAGVVFQAMLRNPLADPYVLGVSSGAGLGAAVAIILHLTALGPWTVPLLAFAGAALTVALVFNLARVGGRISVHTLLLSGVILSAVFGALLMFLVSQASSEGLHGVTWWLLGSLAVSRADALFYIQLALCAAGIAACWSFARELDLMTLGEEPALHLGVEVERVKKICLTVASLLTAVAVSSAGLIGFVGLLVPHVTRKLVGPAHGRLIPAAALAGGAFLVLADAVGRSVIAPSEVPIGVITALCGGPFFLYLLRRRRG